MVYDSRGVVPTENRTRLGETTMYIRRKTAKGRAYYQIVEGKRERTPEGTVVRQRIVMSLGGSPTPEAAVKIMRRHARAARRQRDMLCRLSRRSATQERRLSRL